MSQDMNEVKLLGRLARDPYFYPHDTDPSKNRLFFTLACGRQWTGADGQTVKAAEFISCNLWGARADAGAKYLHKEKQVLVEGRLSIFRKQLLDSAGNPVLVDDKPIYTEQATVQCSNCIYLDSPKNRVPAADDIKSAVDAAVQQQLAAVGIQTNQAAAAEPAPEGSDDPFDV